MSKIKLVKFPLKIDQRGKLTFFETGKNILIPIKRVFSVSIPLKKKRGNHAHKKCTQIIICVQGKIKVVFDNGIVKKNYYLRTMSQGLIIPPKKWIVIYGLSKNSNFIVLCDKVFDKKEYILNYNEYLKIIK